MPKLGMGPIRREQICRAAAAVIAREGFAGTTMRMVAAEAGVSTGMLNHYFANRQALLTQAVVFVSQRAQQRHRAAIGGVSQGAERVNALLDSILAEDERTVEMWRVWINAYGEAVRLPALRSAMDGCLETWYEIIDEALDGVVPPEPPAMPWSWRFDAVLNGLQIQALTSGAELDARQIREEVLRMVLPDCNARPRPRVAYGAVRRALLPRDGAGRLPQV
ncbi:MAG TPA: TetR/AcrR family transcriptional regulator [Solirubrobacteraceae bacterium]